MNLFKLLFVTFLVAFSSIIISCSDSSTNNNPVPTTEVKFTVVLNGGSYNNQTVTFTASVGSVYDATDNQTGFAFNNTGMTDVAVVSFKGNSTGTFQIPDVDDLNVVGITFNTASKAVAILNGSITVTAYGAVGGMLSGTFSGTGEDTEGNVVTFKNGSFNVKRLN